MRCSLVSASVHVRRQFTCAAVRGLSELRNKEENVLTAAQHPAVLAYRNGREGLGAAAYLTAVHRLQLVASKLMPCESSDLQPNLGLGFSAGGLLFPYYIGVVQGLHELHIITPRTQIAGASAGSLIAAGYNAGMTTESILELCMKMAGELRRGGTYQRLGPTLHRFLEAHLPEDAHLRCSNTSHIAITRIFPYAQCELVTAFSSRDDLINCLLTSCQIPVYFDGKFGRPFRGRLSFDGGATNFLPSPPVDYTARVCCFPSRRISIVCSLCLCVAAAFLNDSLNLALEQVRNIHIAPDSFNAEWSRVSLRQLFVWALAPAPEAALLRLVDKGRQDAVVWANVTGVLDAACPDLDNWHRRSFLNEDVLSPALVSVDLLGNKAVELPKGAGAVVSSLIAAKGLQEDPSDGKSKRMQ